MKKLHFGRLAINFILALVFSLIFTQFVPANPFMVAVAIVAVHTVFSYSFSMKGSLMSGLQTEVWVPDIIEQPVPNDSFVLQSRDLSEFVEHNKINLVEAGVEPAVFEDYFNGNEDPLPLANIADIPHEVVLHTYSTEQTRHRKLQDVELAYDKKASIIARHKKSLEKNLGVRAAFAWTPAASNAFNKLLKISDTDSVFDALIDIQAFMAENDFTDNLNVCFTSQHMARMRKEDKKLYKEILNEKEIYGLKVFQYSQNPLFTAAGIKKPMGSVAEATDKRASFVWSSDETFRCFGDVEMYATLNSSAYQADTISFAQRALIGAVRASNPKYFGAIV